MKKRILSVFLALLMVVSIVPFGVFAEDEVLTLYASDVEADFSTQTVSVDVLVKNNPGVAGITLGVKYDDTALKLVGATDENSEVKLGAVLNEDYSGNPYYVVLYRTNNDTSNGILFTLDFEVTEDAVPGEYSVEVVVDKAKDITDQNGENVAYAVEAGCVTLVGEDFNSRVALNDSTVVYDGEYHTPALSGTGYLPDGYTVEYTCDGEDFEGAKDAGTYEVTATLKAFGYNTKTFDATLEIQPRTLGYTVGVGSREYDGTTNVNFTSNEITGIVEGDDVACEVTAQMASASVARSVAVNFDFALSGEDAHNYNVPNTPTVKAAITTRAITVTANGSKRVGEDDPAIELEILSGSLVEGDSFTGMPARVQGEEPGIYAIKKGTLALNSNYKLTFVEGEFEIIDREKQSFEAYLSVEGEPSDTVEYGYTERVLIIAEVEEDGCIPEIIGSISSSSSNQAVATVCSENGFVTIVGAGETIITVTVPGNDYYAPVEIELPLTVTKRALTITADDKTKKIGNDDPEYTYTLEGETAYDDVLEVVLSREEGEAVGTYSISAEYTLTNEASYEVTINEGEFSILDKFPQENIEVNGVQTSVTYGDEGFTVEASTTDDADFLGDITLTSSDENVLSVDGFDVTVKNTGSATLTFTAYGNDDYADYVKEFDVTVKKRAITVAADAVEKYIGQDDPALTYKITEGSLVEGDEITGELTRTAGNTAGRSYEIKIGTLSAGDNYKITYVKNYLKVLKKLDQDLEFGIKETAVYGDTGLLWEVSNGTDFNAEGLLKITPSVLDVIKINADKTFDAIGVGRVTVTASVEGNYMYNDWQHSVTVVVSKKPITINVTDASKKMENDDPQLTYTLEGETAFDDVLEVTLTREEGEALGNYDINAEYTLTGAENYTVKVNKGTFTILDKLPQTITCPEKIELTYGDAPFALEATSDFEGAQITYSLSSEDVVTLTDDNKLKIEGVGEAVVTVTADGNNDYASATKEIKVTVAPKQVSVTIHSSQSEITYGDNFEFVTFYDGFAYGETTDVIEHAVYPDTQLLDVGVYDIAMQVVEATNYTFNYVPFTLTVKPVEIELKNITFFNMEYSEDMDKALMILNVELMDYPEILAESDIRYKYEAELKTEVTQPGTYYAQVTATLEGSDAGNFCYTNEGKYGFEEDIYPVEILETYSAAELKEQITPVLSDTFVSGREPKVWIPEVPEGFEITIKEPISDGETVIIDADGNRVSGVTGVFNIVYVITDIRDADNPVTEEFNTTIEIVEVDEFGVSAIAENGTVEGEGMYTLLDDIVLKATPNSGYKFSHWLYDGEKISSSATFEFKICDIVEIAKNIEITAVFTKKSSGGGGGGGVSTPTYNVIFVDGDKTVATKIVDKGDKVTAPEAPEKQGFTFDGWFADSAFTESFDFNDGITSSITVYAKYTAVEPDDGDDDGDDKDDGEDGNDDGEEDGKWNNPFSDVSEDDWFYSYVEYATEKGLFKGMTETEFGPDVMLSRAMLVTVLYRAEGEPEIAEKAGFEDVSDDAYYAKAVAWAKANGIVNGLTSDSFAPDTLITREQFATIVYRFAQFKKVDTSVGEDTNILSYDDALQISDYAKAAIQFTVGSGVMAGRTQTTVNPKDNATRAEAATILARFFELK